MSGFECRFQEVQTAQRKNVAHNELSINVLIDVERFPESDVGFELLAYGIHLPIVLQEQLDHLLYRLG